MGPVLDHRDDDDPDERDGEANRRRQTGNGDDDGCRREGDEHSESPEFLSRSPQRQSHSTRKQCDTERQRQAVGERKGFFWVDDRLLHRNREGNDSKGHSEVQQGEGVASR